MRKASVLVATSFILASSLLLVGSAQASDPNISITPDTSVFVFGGDSVRIWIYASDPDLSDTITVEKTHGIGTYVPKTDLAPISDEFYFHPDTSGVYTFVFPVTDGQGAKDADTARLSVATMKVDFSQSANDDSPYPPGDVHWIGSILQEGNSNYYEGMSTLQRLVFVGIPKTPGDVHTLSFSHQADKATNHAYDFLTSWPQGVQAATEIGGLTMFVNLNECGPEIGPPSDLGAACAALHTSGFTATPDAPDAMGNLLGDDVASKVAAYEAHLGNRTVKIYGNTPISAASMAFNGYNGSPDKEAHYTLTWTSSSDSIVIEMGGHLAAGIDPIGQAGVGYGPGRGSSNISGGSYHFKLGTLDGASLGSQDHQIKGADIKTRLPACDVTPASQEVCVGSNVTFTDNTTSGVPPYTFCWQKWPYTDPCISTTNQLSITGATLADAGTYRVIVTDYMGGADTCECTLTVYGLPPEIVCPDDDSVHAGDYFISTDFSAWDPDGGPVTVALCGITPPAVYTPAIVGGHVEWQTDCHEAGEVFTICLEATDSCGATDVCYFDVTVENRPPELTCPEDDSVHAQELFVSTDFSVHDPDGDTGSVFILDISPSATNYPVIVDQHVEWQTTCQEDGDYVVRLVASECCQARDTCEFTVTVYNRPPELICPENAMVYAGDTLISTDFSVTDPDGDPAPVTFLYIDPSATNDPTVVGNHVEWITTSNEADREFDIYLAATDPCGLADTCQFTVTVVKVPTGDLTCPEDDSVHATVPAVTFVSTNFSVTGPGADPSRVRIISIDPSPAAGMPYRVESHIEWLTDCDDAGKVFTICLEATFDIEPKDTCCFNVTVYNRPPQLTCPDYGHVAPNETFVSTEISVFDPDGDPVVVTLLSIQPTSTYDPTIVDNHVEWFATCAEAGKDYVITLVATDPCGLADTCEFTVTVSYEPAPDFYIWVYPVTQYVQNGEATDYLVELYSLYGFAEPCSLFVYGLPDPPISGLFDERVLVPTSHTTLHVQTAFETDSGMYAFNITAKEVSGSREHTVEIYLMVEDPADAEDAADNLNAPSSFTLFQNQPNPFNPETRISYYLPRACQVNLSIYNLLGQKVKTLFDGHQDAGMQSLFWDGRSDGGIQLSSGIYFYRLLAGDFRETKKMTLMR
ncbi:MAG: T9SS type A sorting domain-containing protein [candidate division Zixibacteria bacterium]|nr:T9SS type A sorting domain-containing protein [candidate division Zixibacteria bacterium]